MNNLFTQALKKIHRKPSFLLPQIVFFFTKNNDFSFLPSFLPPFVRTRKKMQRKTKTRESECHWIRVPCFVVANKTSEIKSLFSLFFFRLCFFILVFSAHQECRHLVLMRTNNKLQWPTMDLDTTPP